MKYSEALRWAYDKLKDQPTPPDHSPVEWKMMLENLDSLANKYSKYEELASIFQKAQESLEDAKDRLVEP